MGAFKSLFELTNVGSLKLKNRITMSPMFVGYANPDGTVSTKTLNHYTRLARGGVAMIVVEATLVDPIGQISPFQLRIDGDKFIPGLSQIAGVIKENGAVAAIQIHHGGRFAMVPKPVSASDMPYSPTPGVTILPRPLSREGIQSTIASFAKAALRAKNAGFDLVEVHGGTGYLIGQFISPHTNKRDDEYGGDLEGRMRFPLEVVKAVKGEVGDDFPVGYRFQADELLPDGFKLEEAKIFATKLEEAGIVYLSVMLGTFEAFVLPEVQTLMAKECYALDWCEAIKSVASIPVFANGRICRPGLAEDVISVRKFPIVALGRPLIADPEFPNKAYEGKEAKIVECINCGGCGGCVFQQKPVVCSRWSEEIKAEYA